MDTFEHMRRAFENTRRIMDGMCDEEVALLHRSAVETAIAAFRREEITAEQRNSLFGILQPNGRIIIVEPIPRDDET